MSKGCRRAPTRQAAYYELHHFASRASSGEAAEVVVAIPDLEESLALLLVDAAQESDATPDGPGEPRGERTSAEAIRARSVVAL